MILREHYSGKNSIFETYETNLEWALVICREFSHGEDAKARRKSTKEADKDEDFLLQLRK